VSREFRSTVDQLLRIGDVRHKAAKAVALAEP
jgi:hypothetical protein